MLVAILENIGSKKLLVKLFLQTEKNKEMALI